jgi:hypothetical protein
MRGKADVASERLLASYRDNYVILLDGEGQPTPSRANFLPGPDGRIAWFSMFGRLYTRQA